MKPFVVTSILAPTDLSESSLPALRYARLFADRFSAKLTVMYSDPIVYPLDYVGPTAGACLTTPEYQARLRVEVAQHAEETMAGRPYEVDVTIGQPAQAILSTVREKHADLVVMGTHLRHGWRRALLGSVSDGVLHGANIPVLTVARRDREAGARPDAITNILCPVNFTEAARESVQVAGRLAKEFGARLTIVHVIESAADAIGAADEEKVWQWVSPELRGICSFRELVLRGGAAERVLDCADDLGADFLVIGAQHTLFRDATVIGTTTERLLRFAPCPVLVVPLQPEGRDAKSEVETEEPVAVGA
jgi:nucleotide-binding universal stress UspA family protein